MVENTFLYERRLGLQLPPIISDHKQCLISLSRKPQERRPRTFPATDEDFSQPYYQMLMSSLSKSGPRVGQPPGEYKRGSEMLPSFGGRLKWVIFRKYYKILPITVIPQDRNCVSSEWTWEPPRNWSHFWK